MDSEGNSELESVVCVGEFDKLREDFNVELRVGGKDLDIEVVSVGVVELVAVRFVENVLDRLMVCESLGCPVGVGVDGSVSEAVGVPPTVVDLEMVIVLVCSADTLGSKDNVADQFVVGDQLVVKVADGDLLCDSVTE